MNASVIWRSLRLLQKINGVNGVFHYYEIGGHSRKVRRGQAKSFNSDIGFSFTFLLAPKCRP